MNHLYKPITSPLILEKGFTLIELMIVLVILAIITVIAVPAYTAQVMASRRDEGYTVLLQAAVKQEQFYLDNSVYSNDMTDLGFATNPALTPEGFYEISAVIANLGQNFSLTATRKAVQTSDAVCGDLTLNSFGIKSAINATDSDPSKNCW